MRYGRLPRQTSIGLSPQGPLDGVKGPRSRDARSILFRCCECVRGAFVSTETESVMTKKNAKKTAARARQAVHGGKYNAHLRHVGGGGNIQIIQKARSGVDNVRLGAGTSTDPIHQLNVELVNGARSVLLVVLPQAEDNNAWSVVVFHEDGPWPLLDNERAVFESWLDGIAQKHWPERRQSSPARYLEGKRPTSWPGKERDEALAAIHRTNDASQHARRKGRVVLHVNRESQAWLAQWVHIDGTRFDNTWWRLSGVRHGAKIQLGLPEPITHQVVEDAFHVEICPLIVETSADGGFSWTRCRDDSAQWDWTASLALASSELQKLGNNAVRVVSRKLIELARFHRPDLELVPLYEQEARIIMRALEARIPGTASEIARSGPQVPTTKFTYAIKDTETIIHVVLFNGAIWCRATTENPNDSIWRGDKQPLNADGARAAAVQLVAHFTRSPTTRSDVN